jgi:hypothetical protein
MRRLDQVPRRSKHPLLNGHTRHAPLVEIRLTGLSVVKAYKCLRLISTYTTALQLTHRHEYVYYVANISWQDKQSKKNVIIV